MLIKFQPEFLPQIQKIIFDSIQCANNSLNQLFSEMLSILYVSTLSSENTEEISQTQKYIFPIFSFPDRPFLIQVAFYTALPSSLSLNFLSQKLIEDPAQSFLQSNILAVYAYTNRFFFHRELNFEQAGKGISSLIRFLNSVGLMKCFQSGNEDLPIIGFINTPTQSIFDISNPCTLR